MSLLQRILASKRDELQALRQRSLPAPPPLRTLPFPRESHQPLRLLAEIKLRSPSAGPLSRALSVADRARAYQTGGADVISVLCDSPFFDGSFEHLVQARAGCSLPLLCKDFIIDECQLDAARCFGADAALLIVRCLTPSRLRQLFDAAVQRGLVPLVEVANPEEATLALDVGARLIGVNERDLDSLEMNRERATRVLESLPEGVSALHLSGLKRPDDLRRIAQSRADGALVGEALMRQDDPLPLLGEFEAAILPT